jgi:GNAT superfamily N-acetyltransferase
MIPIIRPSREQDAVLLPEVERSAAERFRDLPDLAWIADGPEMPVEAHLTYIAAGSSWVAEIPPGQISGFLAAERFGDELHIWELAVGLIQQGRGLGRRLIEAAHTYAAERGLRALTLTTFRDVAWNAPLYGRMGFSILEGRAIDARLVTVLRREAVLGLPINRRCAMRRAIEHR